MLGKDLAGQVSYRLGIGVCGSKAAGWVLTEQVSTSVLQTPWRTGYCRVLVATWLLPGRCQQHSLQLEKAEILPAMISMCVWSRTGYGENTWRIFPLVCGSGWDFCAIWNTPAWPLQTDALFHNWWLSFRLLPGGVIRSHRVSYDTAVTLFLTSLHWEPKFHPQFPEDENKIDSTVEWSTEEACRACERLSSAVAISERCHLTSLGSSDDWLICKIGEQQ